jgi:DNA-directed RNA polymerase subunit omega
MVFPLEELVKYSGNIYEITVAASRRAYQMAKIEDPEIEQNDGKVVSLAARQVFDNKVTFKIEQQ